MKIVEIRFLGTATPFRAIVDATTIKRAEAITIAALAAAPGNRSASFSVIGNARKADQDSLPTLAQALGA